MSPLRVKTLILGMNGLFMLGMMISYDQTKLYLNI